MSDYVAPEFLVELLDAKSPSGAEFQAQAVFDRHVQPASDDYQKDPLGNRIATLQPDRPTSVMFTGHLDELGFIITYIDENGYLYFSTIGGHDRVIIPGRRVVIQTGDGLVKGVTGKRAIHLMDTKDRDNVPQIHEMWIDIGVQSQDEAKSKVKVGDVATYDHAFELLNGSVGTARAFDNKAGAYIVGETLIRASRQKSDLAVKLVSVGTAQEEIGVRGATTSSFAVNPTFAVAVDVGHSTDHPDCDKRKYGETKLGAGPIITRGPNINPVVYKKLIQAAEDNEIPYQLEGDPRPTGTDARAIQMARAGIATGLISVPLRYMHTPSEIVDLEDIENGVRLLLAFAKSVQDGEDGNW